MRIGVLERPAAGTQVRPPRDPVAAHVENLHRHQPVEALLGLRGRALAAGFEQRMAGKASVPDRRDARLAIGFLLVHDQELLHRLAGDGALRMIFRIPQHVVHHHAVRHRRKDRAQAVLAVEALADPGDGAIDRALMRGQPAQQQRLDHPQHVVDAAEEPEPRRLLLRRLRRRAEVLRRSEEQLVDPHALGVARHRPLRHQHQQRHDNGAAPVRHLVEMDRKPLRQQHDLDRHHRHGAPGNEAEQRQHDAREHVGAFGAAARA